MRKPIVEKLERAQESLLRAAGTIPADCWRIAPREGAWSAAEVIAHLMIVERGVLLAAGRILQKQAQQIPLRKRFRLPLMLVEWRLIRRKSPVPMEPRLLREKEAMLAEWKEVRGRTLALMEETRDRDLSAYRWRHPFLGSLNAYDWFSFLGSHQIRHEKQMREIAANLPKKSAGSRK
jgi:hypothetical protein